MIKADSFCLRRSDDYTVKIVLGSAMTVTVLFIMILPRKVGAEKLLVKHQCGIPGAGAWYFFNVF